MAGLQAELARTMDSMDVKDAQEAVRQAQAELELQSRVPIAIVEIHERAPRLPIVDLDERKAAALTEPHDGHGFRFEPPLPG